MSKDGYYAADYSSARSTTSRRDEGLLRDFIREASYGSGGSDIEMELRGGSRVSLILSRMPIVRYNEYRVFTHWVIEYSLNTSHLIDQS